MDTKAVITKILSNTFTKSDCYRRLLLLTDFFDQEMYGTETPAGADMIDQLSRRFSDSPDRSAIAAWGFGVLEWLADDRKRIAELKRSIEALPELVLYVPSAMSTEYIMQIGRWIRANVAEDALIDMRIDPAYVGGCALAWKGRFYDFSLGYFWEKHQEELSVLLEEKTSKSAPRRAALSQT